MDHLRRAVPTSVLLSMAVAAGLCALAVTVPPAFAAPRWQFDAGASSIAHSTGACATNTCDLGSPVPLWGPPDCVTNAGSGFGVQAFAPLGAFSYSRRTFCQATCPDTGTGLSFVSIGGDGTSVVRIRWLIDARSYHNCDAFSPPWTASGMATMLANVRLTIVDPAQPAGSVVPVDYLWSVFSFNNYKNEAVAEDPANVRNTMVLVNAIFNPPLPAPPSVWEPGLAANFFDLPLLRGFRNPPAGVASFNSAVGATVPVVVRGLCDTRISDPGVVINLLTSPRWKDAANTVFQGQLILSLSGPVDQSTASCFEPALSCPPNATLPCTVDHPSPGCGDPACCTLVCQIDPGCCVGPWDFNCVAIAQLICPAGHPACGAPGAGPCNSAHPSPGCSNPACCNLVCSYDSQCCDVEWDSLCAQLAQIVCDDCCPAGAVQEAEACGASTNGGCDVPGVPVQQINCGAVICGTAWATGGLFDSDWYQLFVPPNPSGRAVITAELASAFPAFLLIVNTACPAVFLGASESSLGFPGETSACVAAPGTYRVQVAPGTYAGGVITTGLPCGSGNNYILSVDCQPGCPSPSNNQCANAITIGVGPHPFNSLGATTDGPPTPCGQIGSDLWYRFIAPCSGTLTAATCNAANYDSMLGVYNGISCAPFGALLVCNDDTPGCGVTSTASAIVVGGQSYLIRLGGFSGTTGIGTLTLSMATACPCPADLNGDGTVNSLDLGILLSSWSIPPTAAGCAGAVPCPADLNHDGFVNSLDLGILLASWSIPPGSPCP